MIMYSFLFLFSIVHQHFVDEYAIVIDDKCYSSPSSDLTVLTVVTHSMSHETNCTRM